MGKHTIYIQLEETKYTIPNCWNGKTQSLTAGMGKHTIYIQSPTVMGKHTIYN
jgi:hypothetical protein